MIKIHNNTELTERLKTLKLQRQEYEQAISSELVSLYKITKEPAPFLKNTLNQMAADSEVKKDLLKVGLHFASDYLVEHYVFRKADTFLNGLVSSLKNATAGKNELVDQLLAFISKKR